MIFVSKTSDGDTVRWEDNKRYLWLFSVMAPSLPGICALALLLGGSSIWAYVPIVFYYFFIPAFDGIVGEDATNPPEEIVEQLSQDGYYRLLLYLSIPVFFFSFFAVATAVGTVEMSWIAIIVLSIATGASSGSSLTVAHELGHKLNRADRLAARLMTALTGYAHFIIEHNQGHHVMVATDEDAASARYGESIYGFVVREIPATAIRGWDLETKRLKRRGNNFWSFQNEVLQIYLVTLIIVAVLIALFGAIMVPFLLMHHATSWFHLSMANYVEHYGLKREKLPNGKYEPCEPRHSWNTNHVVSNVMLFHLQRHSDHHSNPMRPYQSLRDLEDLPRLPSGYPGTFLLTLIPPVWFSVMNPKVLAWAGGDVNKVNRGPQ